MTKPVNTSGVDLAPFAPGEEVRTFSAKEFDLLAAGLVPAIRPRTLAAARLVLVDKIPYRHVALIQNETPQFVRMATLSVMERFGLTGPSFYQSPPHESLVFRRVPEKYHHRVKQAVGQLLAALEAEETAQVFDNALWDNPDAPGPETQTDGD